MKENTVARRAQHRQWRLGEATWPISLLACVFGAAVLANAQAPQDAQPAAQQPDRGQSTASSSSPSSLAYVQFGVSLEGDYEFNGNRPFDRINLLRAYDTRANVFGIQQAAIVVESAPAVERGRRFGARIDLQFGQATEAVQGSPANEPRPEVYRNLWQAYGTYVFPVGRGLQVDFGKFASNLGYETNYAKDNSQFSRGYLFNFLPFYYSGVRAALPVTGAVTVMYAVTNGIQQTEDFNDFKSQEMTLAVKPARRVTWTVSYYAGHERPDGERPDRPDAVFRVFDTYLSVIVTPKLTLRADLNEVTNTVRENDEALSLRGVGVYARYQASGPTALSVRYEHLDDEGLFTPIAQVLEEATATAEYRFADGFLLRGELRRDWSNRPFFTTHVPGRLRHDQNTVTVGLIWWFGNKGGAW